MTLCIGCGLRPAPKHRYCALCRERLDHGWQCLEHDAIPTADDIKRIRAVYHTGPFLVVDGGK